MLRGGSLISFPWPRPSVNSALSTQRSQSAQSYNLYRLMPLTGLDSWHYQRVCWNICLMSARIHSLCSQWSQWSLCLYGEWGESYCITSVKNTNRVASVSKLPVRQWTLITLSPNSGRLSKLPVRQWTINDCQDILDNFSKLPVRQWTFAVRFPWFNGFSKLHVRQWTKI